MLLSINLISVELDIVINTFMQNNTTNKLVQNESKY